MKNKTTWILATAIGLLLLGIVLQLTVGNLFSAGEYSLNYFAAGDFACGVFAAGKFSIGIFSVGIFSIGIFSLGIFNIGIYAIGIFVWAWKKRLPNMLLDLLKTSISNAKLPLVILIFVGLSYSASAQNRKPIQLAGGFGGPFMQTTAFSSEATLAIGGGGAMVFTNGFFIGGYGVGTSDAMDASADMDGYKLKVEYGGPWLGYLLPLGKRYRISGSLKTGFGEAQLVNDEESQLYFDNLVVFTPEIAISARLGILAVELGFFYNQFTGVDFHDQGNDDFSSFGTSLMFKFGGGYY